MKKIISGRMYDTTTARELGHWSDGLGWRDFSHVEETLYRKRTGEYFLHGAGGARTRYSKRVGNMMSDGEDIIPMTAADAREWAENKLDADEYVEIFGMPEEGTGEKSTLCIQLPADLMARVRTMAADGGKSLTAQVEELLRMAIGD